MTPIFRRQRVHRRCCVHERGGFEVSNGGEQISKRLNAGWLLVVLSCASLFRWSFLGLLAAVAPRARLGASGLGFWFVLVAPSPSFRMCFTFQTDRLRAPEAQKQECAVGQCRSKDLAFQVSLTEAVTYSLQGSGTSARLGSPWVSTSRRCVKASVAHTPVSGTLRATQSL